MFEKLEALYKKYQELTELISNPDVIADQASWRKYMKEQSNMKDVVDKYVEYKKLVSDMESAKEMMDDPDLKEMAEEEYYSAIQNCNNAGESTEFIEFMLKMIDNTIDKMK